jgi:hypothetical protein
MYTYDYDFSYSPSMPVVNIEVTPVARQAEPLNLVAMIDSGSDG